MWDFIETVIFIILIFILAIIGGLFLLGIGVVLSPLIIIIMLIIAITYLVDKIINLIRVCKGKEEKHILNIEIEEGDNNDKRGKDI